MARTWLSIRVDLVSGRGENYWPRPGRVFAAARSHRFSQLAEAIDTAFARWDHSHLYKFEQADGRVIGQPEFDDFDVGFLDGDVTTLSTLSLGEQDWARRVVAAADDSGGAAVRVDGEMIDRPRRELAHRILASAAVDQHY